MEAPNAQVASEGAWAALVLGQRWGMVTARVKELPSRELVGQAGGWVGGGGRAARPGLAWGLGPGHPCPESLIHPPVA